MLVAIMAVAVVLDSHTSPDPASLVDQLGSSRYAVRVSAEGELARLGRAALPALRAARNSKDAEIRTRSVALVSRIENSLLLQSTPVGLDFRDVPLPEVIDAIARQAGSGLSLALEERPLLAGRRISLRSNGPLPFWEAIDVICSAGRLHPVLGDQPTRGGFDSTLLLLDGPLGDSGPVSDDGPFRVVLSSLHYQSEIQLDQPRPAPTGRGPETDTSLDPSRPPAGANREFFLQLALSAEPRLSVSRNGAIKLIEAVDDRGRTLLGQAGPGRFRHSAGYSGMNPSSMLRFRVDLEYPASPTRRIKALRGSIPIIVASRKPDPLVVPLADSRGKTIRGEEVALTVLDHRPASTNQPATVQVAIRPVGAVAGPINSGAGEPLGYRPDSFQQQVDILDNLGRPLPWFPSSSFYDGEETRLTLTVGPRGAPIVPATLRFHGILKANADVAFEFRDIPMP